MVSVAAYLYTLRMIGVLPTRATDYLELKLINFDRHNLLLITDSLPSNNKEEVCLLRKMAANEQVVIPTSSISSAKARLFLANKKK